MQRYQNSILKADGNHTVPVAGATVTVYLTGTTDEATLYSDNAGTALPNPTTSDTVGNFYFYVQDGRYDIVLSGGTPAIIATTISNIEVFDASEVPTYMAHEYQGSDAGEKVAAAITDLPTTGGVVDGRGFEGVQTFSTDIFVGVTKQVELILGNSTITVGADTTIPENVQLFLTGTIFDVPTGKTLTINGPIDALPTDQLFSLSGTGTVVLGGKTSTAFYPQWWGAKADGLTDDTAALQSAITAANAVLGNVYLPCGTYLISSTLDFAVQGSLLGETAASNASGSCVTIKADAALDPMINLGHSNIRMENIRVDANALAVKGIRTRAGGSELRAYHIVLNNVAIQNFSLTDDSVIALDLGDYDGASNQYAGSDCLFYGVDIKIGDDYQAASKGQGIGIYISREDNHFYGLQLAGFGKNIVFGGGDHGGGSGNVFHGGAVADSAMADVSVTTSAVNVQNYFYGVWFEGSYGNIVGSIPDGGGGYVDQRFHFDGCHLNTYSDTSIMDLTNLVGKVTTTNCVWDISDSALIITSTLGAYWGNGDSFASSLSFTGINYYLEGAWTAIVPIGTLQVDPDTCGNQTLVPTPTDFSTWEISVNNNIYQNMIVWVYADVTPQLVLHLCNYTDSAIVPTAGSVIVKARP